MQWIFSIIIYFFIYFYLFSVYPYIGIKKTKDVEIVVVVVYYVKNTKKNM